MPDNRLYFGDNLEILRDYIGDETVDLIYLDPPFNSNQDYNVLFSEKNGSQAESQIRAFEDTWRWDKAAAEAYHELVEGPDSAVSRTMQAFRQMIGENDMLAYLAMMAPRLIQMRRVLKNTGSIYLHCDSTASHYLKLLMDGIFGPENFRNEIIWKRTSAHSGSKRWGPVHDVILFYANTSAFIWNPVFQNYTEEYINNFYRFTDENGLKFRVGDLTGAGTRTGESGQPWCGVNPTDVGRHWAVPNKILKDLFGDECSGWTVQQKLDGLNSQGFIVWPKKGKIPQFKRYLNMKAGVPIVDVISDIKPIGAQAAERLGYPTQKPEALLERIIKASSNEGDIVLDPFCGCGTSIVAAQNLKRNWIGIDITYLAIALMKYRLLHAFGDTVKNQYEIHGLPVSVSDAEALAKQDTHEFELWALGLVDARPTQKKKGADRGIDGRLYFHEDPNSDTRQLIISVKSGKTGVAHVRDLRGVIEREDAEIGVLITLQEPTAPMRTEAVSAGFFESHAWNTKHPRIQILTIEELLDGKVIDYPAIGHSNVTFKKAQKKSSITDKQTGLALEE